MEYDEEILKKQLGRHRDTHLFSTDVYKPRCCKIEEEIRFLLYLTDSEELPDHFSGSETQGSERFEAVCYDFGSNETIDTGPSIEKVFCKNSDTYQALCKLFERQCVVLLDG